MGNGPWAMTRPAFVLACVMALCASQSGSAQEPEAVPTFSSESQLVVLHVAVRDGKGYVGGLGQESFRVLDERRPQDIRFFNSQDAPVTVGLLIDSSASMS